MRIENVVFDLDGTLLDTSEGIIDSVIHAVNELDLPPLSKETVAKFIGPPIQESFANYCNCDEKTTIIASKLFRDYYKDVTLLEAKPYDGIYDVCDKLKKAGINLAVATYKREDYALRLLNEFGFNNYCISMHGADNDNILRKSDILDLCIREMGGTNETTVLIGDTDHDAKGALAANTRFLAVTYGFGYKNGYKSADSNCIGVADKPLDILEIINRINCYE
ncbi:MAG: HAD hydrolase-like protein [Eubacterium sp.]|nr:HAD hydrolase-like protein [Eubacterium sp.]MBR0412737.1 HAD hydrolase-like protein [Eubacterium sp.]